MIGIVWHGLTARWSSIVGSLVALTLGVALAATAGLALVSAVTGSGGPPRWYVSPHVVVAGPGKAGFSAADPTGVPGASALPPGERGHIPVETATTLGEVSGVIHAAGVSPSQALPETILKVDLYGTALVLDASSRSNELLGGGSVYSIG